MKYYAVKKGKKTGIFKSWPECEANVKSYSGAIYKSFATLQQAQEYLAESLTPTPSADSNELKIYTDGSFIDGCCGYGAVILEKHQCTQLYGPCTVDFGVDSRNIVGECVAVIKALTWVKENKYPSARIYHDYIGVAAWANGEWKAKSPIAKWYIEQFKRLSLDVSVSFVHIKGHSGHRWNEKADELAKQGAHSYMDHILPEEKEKLW